MAVGVVAVGAVAVAWFILRDTVTPVDTAAVEGAFAGEVGMSPGDPGVYRYATTGFEEIDALAGARHDYPAETFMTIEDGPCGPVVRWDALEERWIDWEHCGSALAVTTSQSFHQWFGVPDLETESCGAGRPISGAIGSAVTTTCDAGGEIETYDSEVVALESMEIAGVTLETVHLRRTSELSGESSGSAVVDVWRLIDSPLIVRMEVSRHSSTPSPVGAVNYEEEFTLLLVSSQPQG